MADIARVLQEEIARLSRKEIKKVVNPLRKRVAVLSRTVTRQTKIIDGLNRTVTRQSKLLSSLPSTPKVAPEAEARKARVSPGLIKSQRKRLKLNQSQFARLIGVSVAAVRAWEQGRSQPRGVNLGAFIVVRKLKLPEVRERLGITPVYKKRGRPKKRGRRKKR